MKYSKDKNLLVTPQTSLFEAMAAMDKNSEQLLLVVDESQRLVGVMTDGDIRRAILSGRDLHEGIETMMNRSPKVAKEGEPRSVLIRRMKSGQLPFLPKVDSENRFIEIIKLTDIAVPRPRRNRVVIMAGGRGLRLGALTDNCPKPMLRMGGKPILEILIELLSSFGFYDFVLSVHYLKDKIIEYFGDGARFGVNVSYLHEDSPLGTAGVLSSLELSPGEPFVVINGDIYTDVDFSRLLDHHCESGCFATMCVREFRYQIPFGVIKSEKNEILGIEEKPELSYLVNAGIYVFDPRAVDLVPKNEFFPMTSLIEKILNQRKSVGSYLIDGFWFDIGRKEDLDRASTLL